MTDQNFNGEIEPSEIQSNPKKDDFMRRFMDTIKSEEPVLIILKCHLLSEYYLNELLMSQLPRSDHIINSHRAQFGYMQKLCIIDAMQIIPNDYVDSLTQLNKVRNNCGHESQYTVTEKDIDNIGTPFGLKYSQLKRKVVSGELDVYLHDLLLNVMMTLLPSLGGHVDGLTANSRSNTNEMESAYLNTNE